jgi:hypothetical protein
MRETFLFANFITFLVLWFLGLTFFYYVVKTAVRNGVLQANEELVESEKAIKRSVIKIKGLTKKESS